MKKTLICGGGGFIGSHLAIKLKKMGCWVRCVDLKLPEFESSHADEFILGDLRDPSLCRDIFDMHFDEVYQLAADMGGAGYVFTGEHDFDIMHNSALINLNILDSCKTKMPGKIFYSSSACIYPSFNQMDPKNPKCAEETAYPADPDSEYGWEKLFSERLYLAFMRNYGIRPRIARFHNIFGEKGTWSGGREKAPAALCRKVAEAPNNGEIEIWGDGNQTRSFLYIEECLEGIARLVDSDFIGPVNIGSEEMVSIDELAKMIIAISGKDLSIKHIEGPVGVAGRNSDNKLIREKLHWAPSQKLVLGLEKTYEWIEGQVAAMQK